MEILLNKFDTVLNTVNISKDVYNALIERKVQFPMKLCEKWNNVLQIHM